MSKINQIEKLLQEIDATKFHKLIDAYLSKAYSYHIVSNGTKLGEDKPAKGTPDSYAVLENKNYVFIEYTTQKTNIESKFLKDIAKCFDEEKTGIPIDNIEKIVLACNSDLSPEEIKNLKNACTEKNVECIVHVNSTIANELFSIYPSIAKEFLSIEIDSGQILDYDDFIKNYDSNKYSTSLNTCLLGREEEVENLYSLIENHVIVLVTGVAGVGKTKLTLEVCRDFAEAYSYQFKIILNRGADIFDDMRSYFNDENERYIIFIDDVNRIHFALEYIQEYFGEKLQSGHIKVVATVRDYAKEKIVELIPQKLHSGEFELNVLKDDAIKSIVKNEYEITNPAYLDRILDISQGNPRLALMAASVAKEQDNLESIYDVTVLYDEYFSRVKDDSEIFNQDNLLLTIVIVSFFRVVDKSNADQMELVERVFQISPDKLWHYVEELHNLEIFDLYENEVVKVSDQILSTYLFYKIVFVDKKIPINIFVEHLFPRYKARFVEVLNPLLSTFDTQYIMQVLKEPVNNMWDMYQSNEEVLYELVNTFWFLKQTDILIYFDKKITSLDSDEVDISTLDFWDRSKSNLLNDDILDRLVLFKHDTLDSMQIAIELILKYFEKIPLKFKDVINALINHYGFELYSYRYGYQRELILLQTVWDSCDNGQNALISKLYIQLCSELLKTEFEDNKFKNNQFFWQSFKLSETQELQKLRDDIFKNLSLLYKKTEYQKDIINLIREYPSGISFKHGTSKVELWDSENIIKFIEKNFNSDFYEHAKVVNECLDAFDRHKLSYDKQVREKFYHKDVELENIMSLDRFDISSEMPKIKGEKTDWDEVREIIKTRLAELVKDYKLDDWEQLFKKCIVFFNDIGRNKYKIENNLRELFNILIETDKPLYIQVFEKYLELGNPFNININLFSLIEILGKEEAYKLLQTYDYNYKTLWLFRFFQDLPVELIDKEDVEVLLSLYKTAEDGSIPYNSDYLKKFFSLEEDIYVLVSRILIEKHNDGQNLKQIIDLIINSHADIFENLEIYFKNDIKVIEDMYLICTEGENHFDYDSKSLGKLISMDDSFLEKYIHKLFENKKYISSHDINNDHTSLWLRDDFEKIFFELIELVFSVCNENDIWGGGEVLKGFFATKKEKNTAQDNADTVIKKYIDIHSQDENRMEFIFELIAEFTSERRKELILYFLNKNDSYDVFKKLSLESRIRSWTGSRVPYLQKDIDFYLSLFENMKGIQFLQHRKNIEEKISYIDEDIKREKKKDFMSDY